LSRDEIEVEQAGPLHELWNLPLEIVEPNLPAARKTAGATDRALQHRQPGVLIGEVARQIDLVRRLHIEQRLSLVAHRNLRDLQRINELVGREAKTRRRDFAVEGAVLVALHL